jgi:hypothetical protein
LGKLKAIKEAVEAASRQLDNYRTIYHGTTAKAAAAIDNAGFDLSKSADGTVWFTSNPDIGEVAASGKGAIVARRVDESSLKLGGWDEADKYSTDQLIQMGYDGLRLEDAGETTYQIFHPEKLEKVLDMSQSARMARAAEQGYTRDLYHATFNNFDRFEPGHVGASGNETAKIGHWMADTPDATSGFWSRESREFGPRVDPKTGDVLRWEDGSPKSFRKDDEIASIMPLKAKIKKPLVFETDESGDAFEKFMDWRDQWASYISGEKGTPGAWRKRYIANDVEATNLELRKYLEENGYDAIELRGTMFDSPDGKPINQIVVPYGKEANLRSVNAAFDPANIGKNDLMGSIDPRLLAPVAAAGAAGGYAMQNYAPAEMPPLDPAYAEFARRREAKRDTWRQLKESVFTLGSAMAGGIVGDLSRLGGYLNPLMPVEQTEQGAQGIENALMYQPTGPNRYLEGLGRVIEQAQDDFAPLTDAIPQSIPGRAYNALPERIQGLARILADMAL